MGRAGGNEINRNRAIIMQRLSYAFIFIILKVLFFLINNRPVKKPYYLTTYIDDLIPFFKYAVIPYVYWYFFLAFGLIFLAAADHKSYFGLLGSIYTGEVIAFIVYLFFPSTTQRPDIDGNGLFSGMTGMLYRCDAHMNCLPSLHIMESMLVMLFLLRYRKTFLMRVFAVGSSVMIILSTVLIKQHAVLDVFVTLILTFFVYYLVTSDKIHNNERMRRLISRVIPEQLRRDCQPRAGKEAGNA